MNLFFSEIYSISRVFFSFIYKSSSTYCHNCLIQNSAKISYADVETKPIVQIF